VIKQVRIEFELMKVIEWSSRFEDKLEIKVIGHFDINRLKRFGNRTGKK
jgi:hypothetical protein